MKYFYKGLVGSKKQKAGRNRNGRISIRRRGGGCSRLYRKINFDLSFNRKDNYKLVRIEYDPNRSARIGLVYNYRDNLFHYILLHKYSPTCNSELGQLNTMGHSHKIVHFTRKSSYKLQ